MEQPQPAPASPVESIDRALRTLEVVAAAGPRGVMLAELAAALDVHKTTVHRSLAALRFREYVVQDPGTGRYALGAAAMHLADLYFAEDDLPARLRAALVALSAATGELVHLGVLSGTQVVYLDKVEPERSVRVWSAVGRRRSAVSTALGRALLAASGITGTALREYLDALPAVEGLDRGARDEHVADELSRARRRGYAVEVQENEPGIACVAVPILREGGRPVAAVSITAPVERMDADRMSELHAAIRRVLPPLLPSGFALPAA
ncbi:MAG TPA: IclR family transcriptional regulator [Cellulomonas sp.]